jgi:hypothetical protein
MATSLRALTRALQAGLSPDLLTPDWRARATTPLSGHCYVASEAAWHLLGGTKSTWRPQVARVGDITHWWLQGPDGILDITAGQFADPFDYSLGRGCGFLTKQPSKRAQRLMDRCHGRTFV